MNSSTWPAYSFAFQPIVNCRTGEVVSHEALIRGAAGASAGSVLAAVPAAQLPRFDATARLDAIRLAARLRIPAMLNLNFLPVSLEHGNEPISSALRVAAEAGLPHERLCIEVTESQAITDMARFAECVLEIPSQGVQIAIDDFGAGHSGLNLLADFQPDAVKLDMNLIRDIHRRGARQAIVRAVNQVSLDLGIMVIAEGVETPEEYRWLRDSGIDLFQGYYVAKPGFESLPAIRSLLAD